jgi:hypothetical protein
MSARDAVGVRESNYFPQTRGNASVSRSIGTADLDLSKRPNRWTVALDNIPCSVRGAVIDGKNLILFSGKVLVDQSV